MAINHKTKHVKYYSLEADIDEDIADLILNLWKLDIITFNSCQDNVPDNWVWIEFASVKGAEQFLSMVSNSFSEEPDSLYHRIAHALDDDDEPNCWKYNIHLDDKNVFLEEDKEGYFVEYSVGKPMISFSLSIRFPDSDLEQVSNIIADKAKKYGH